MMILPRSAMTLAVACVFHFALSSVCLACCGPAKCDKQTTCGDHGTSVVFAKSPAEAASQALAEEKLVFVLHVSGNFETPNYT